MIFFTSLDAFAFSRSMDDNVEITADKLEYDKTLDEIHATGNVKLTSGDTTLEADNVTYSQGKGHASVEGEFILSAEEDVITGKDMEYSFERSTGSMSGASIFIKKDNLRIAGDHIQKVGENEYTIRGAAFTTCDGDNPSWIVKASKIDVEIGEYLFADHARLYLKNIPVLYTPLFIAPVKTERQTGLLIPKLGYSNRDGFTYRQPLFWAIAKNQDATITFRHEGDRGRGGDLEYRYVRTLGSKGEMNFQYIKEKEGGKDKRWWGNLRHNEKISSTMDGLIDINIVSDGDYFLDYGENVNIYSQQRSESKASVIKNWSYYSLLAEFRHQKNLLVEEDTTLQKLPEITFTAKGQEIADTPLFLQAVTKLTNFWREKDDKAAGLISGQRLDIYPTLSLPFAPGNIFELTPKLGLRETVYYTDDRDKKRQNRNMYDFSLDFLIPFNRIYDIKDDPIEKLKHTIEPGFSYSYISDVDQADLPYYDSIDRISRAKKARIMINNYLTTKETKGEDEIVYNRLLDMKIYRDYDFLEADRTLISASDERKPWGPLTGKLTLSGEGMKALRLESELRYDTYDDKMTYLSADLEGKYKKLTRLLLSYRYTPDSQLEYVDGTIKIAPFDDLTLAYRGRYSMTDELFLESLYGAQLTRQCWSITISYSKRLIPEENKIYLEVSLKGLGELGDRGELL
ncbi:MAG: LPS-assembly protein LptD [Proteobacteria bacterium]|nr:LPS-assembly protein LptD [Pseudomonadota bacterium]